MIKRECKKNGYDTIEMAVMKDDFKYKDLAHLAKKAKELMRDIPFESNGQYGYILERGQSLFSYVAEDEESRFRVAVNNSRMYIKIYALTFMKYDLKDILDDLKVFLSAWEVDPKGIKISRLDWACDIQYNKQIMKGLFNKERYSKSHNLDIGEYKRETKGKTIYKGLSISSSAKKKHLKLRIYDKMIESIDLKDKSKMYEEKYYLNSAKFGYKHGEYYKENLLNGTDNVVRYELELKREFLKSRDIDVISDLYHLDKVSSVVAHYMKNHTGIKGREFKKVIEKIDSNIHVPRVKVEKEDIPERANESIMNNIVCYVKAYHKNLMRIDKRSGKKQYFNSLSKVLENIQKTLVHKKKYGAKFFFELCKDRELKKVIKIKGDFDFINVDYFTPKQMAFPYGSNLSFDDKLKDQLKLI